MRIVVWIVFFISAVSVDARSIIEDRCELSIDYRKGDLKEPQPLILTDNDGNDKEPSFLLPSANKLLIIPFNASILLSCPGRKNYLRNFTRDTKSARAACLGGKKFLVISGFGSAAVHEFSTLRCQTSPKETVRKKSFDLDNDVDNGCPNGQSYEIGFVHGDSFLRLLEICRDENTTSTLYVKSWLAKEIAGYQSGYPRPFWKYGSYYYPYNMNRIYKIDAQLSSLAQQLGGLDELARRYLRPGEQYLNRGHLVAKADFIYGSQQSASFWLLNTAPQWSSFNAGNWMMVEAAVRAYATRHRVDLDVYTGTHGTSRLPGMPDGERLHLYANGTVRAFLVPRYFWKVMRERKSGKAIAFVGLNEPYAENFRDKEEPYVLCPDIGDARTDKLIGWEPRSREKGLSYLCEVEALRKMVPTVPRFSGGKVGVISL